MKRSKVKLIALYQKLKSARSFTYLLTYLCTVLWSAHIWPACDKGIIETEWCQ